MALSIALIVFVRSIESLVAAGWLLAILAWIWITTLVERRLTGGAPRELVVTTEGIRGPLWSLRWERVRSIRIGRTHAQTGSQLALLIESMSPPDVELHISPVLRFNARLNARFSRGHAWVLVLQAHVDQPLDQLLGELEAYAGRDLSPPPVPMRA
ncbi:MAG TPA: hypothetical protein VLK24_06320 [Gaiellaceae bacterium]|nr:hypothetical protein [Gaiellaceae bacterium]